MAFSLATRNASMVKGTARASASRRTTVVVKAQTGKEYMLTLPGICAPTGFFDPAGFTDSPAFTISEAKRFRECEVTHGRVAMLATLGWLTQEEFHPLFGGQVGGPAFNHFQKVEGILPQFWEFILLAIGISEAARISIAYSNPKDNLKDEQIRADHIPGDLGFDPLNLYPTEAQEQYDLKTKEINNGRLAMIAIAGFAAQEEVDHITIWKGLVKENIVPAAEANLFQ